ncbi:MAG: tetratricopeptide repeat protein, partial [Quisquiliibacterium sp.]
MKRVEQFWIMSAGAALLTAGCAQTSHKQSLDAVAVKPLYRFSEPVGTADGQYAVGRIDLAEGRVDDAILRFRAALRLDPKLADARNALGVAYGQQGRLREAIAEFQAALRLDPKAAHVLNNLGYALLKAGEPLRAQLVLERAIDLD